MKSCSKYDVIIIGAGPAGLSAAIYLLRAGVNVLLLEASSPGGMLNKTVKIDNYPGYLESDGTTLAYRMYNQVKELNIDYRTLKVFNINEQDGMFEVICDKEKFISNYVIIASGRIPKKLDIDKASSYVGKGISYCAICDGALYKNKDVMVIGGGNSAMEAAGYLSSIANKVYVINRSNNLRTTKKELEDVKELKNVEIIYNAKAKELIIDDDKIVGIKLDNDETLNVSGIFVYIGLESNDAYYQNLNLLSDKLGLIVDVEMKTSNDRVYACGDSISKSLYQVVTATSEGAIAASSIIKRITKK